MSVASKSSSAVLVMVGKKYVPVCNSSSVLRYNNNRENYSEIINSHRDFSASHADHGSPPKCNHFVTYLIASHPLLQKFIKTQS